MIQSVGCFNEAVLRLKITYKYHEFKKLNPMQLTEYEQKAINKLGQSIHDGKWSNSGMVKLIELLGDYLNPLSIQEFADHRHISYQAARKHKQTILFRQKFITDND